MSASRLTCSLPVITPAPPPGAKEVMEGFPVPKQPLSRTAMKIPATKGTSRLLPTEVPYPHTASYRRVGGEKLGSSVSSHAITLPRVSLPSHRSKARPGAPLPFSRWEPAPSGDRWRNELRERPRLDGGH